MSILQIILLVIITLILVRLSACLIHVVPQAKACVVERPGAYHTTWNTGIHILVPFVDRASNKVILKGVVKDFAPQPVITKDNVTMQIDTVIYFQVTDPKLYTYGVVGPVAAIEDLIATILCNIVGSLELGETLTSRDIINTKMRAILDEATDPQDIKVNRVEVRSIIPPRDIQETIEKQTHTEHEQREPIPRAEGEKRSGILTAEGERGATVLRANAKKEAMTVEAEGQARATERIYEAQARGIEMIKNANPTKEYLSLKSSEICEKVTDGKATKIVVPSEIQNMASSLISAREILVDDAAKDALEKVTKLKKG